MPVPAYYEPHNPNIQLHQQNGNPIIPGLGRMWGAVNYKDIFGNKEIFNWDLIKKEWLDTWKSNKKYNDDSILSEKLVKVEHISWTCLDIRCQGKGVIQLSKPLVIDNKQTRKQFLNCLSNAYKIYITKERKKLNSLETKYCII